MDSKIVPRRAQQTTLGTPMKGTLRRQSLCLGTVGVSGASYILEGAQCHLLWPGH
jgi:hypothetical protein